MKKNNYVFSNFNFPPELNKFLDIMLKCQVPYKKKLLCQLENAVLRNIERDIGFIAYVLDIESNLFDDSDIPTPALEMLVFSDKHFETEFLLHWTKNIKELEIYNVAGENYLELENFSDIVLNANLTKNGENCSFQ